ncbi:hypothetical protein F5Y17DRAFT_351708 [Xylariaceae sp. FL0594]|nr:hypothetical protein F5Y17DRAFT_351708 [Xylariaceae sp. FL0594]
MPIDTSMGRCPQRNNHVRRPHSKSRTGCQVCKTRRVKCDETRPSCRRCITHGVVCDFALAAEASRTRPPAPGGSSRDALSIQQLTTPSVSSTPETPLAASWFSVDDLELFHHFITSTSLTLAEDPVARSFWRINVPQSGFQHHYVLKGVLALAALHLARLRPRRRDSYVEQAMVHHSAASTMALPMITKASGENFPPVFHFSMLTTIITFARPRGPDNLLVVSDGIIPDWLVITRGLRTLLQSEGDAVLSMASLDALFYQGMQLQTMWEQMNHEHEGLRDLANNFKGRVSPHKQAALEGGMLSLRRSFNIASMNNATEEQRMRGTLMWMVMLPDDFSDLLKSQDSEALCVLAFFCVLLKRLEHLWWVEGWAFHLIERIYKTLDDKYRLWIRWPLEEIGWAP